MNTKLNSLRLFHTIETHDAMVTLEHCPDRSFHPNRPYTMAFKRGNETALVLYMTREVLDDMGTKICGLLRDVRNAEQKMKEKA